MILCYIFKLLFLLICALLSIAFLTLLERKTLSCVQKRKGPNKLSLAGILQPFSDAVKLLFKETLMLNSINMVTYYSSPVIAFLISLILWFNYPSTLGNLEISLSVIFILCCLSASVYPILGAGWASNSKFSMLGSLRAVAQTISYEVSFAVILLSLVGLIYSYMVTDWLGNFNWATFMILPIPAILWFISILAETNRTPFDFAEGESELVSGFNTEYMAGGFVLFFLAEYSSILFMSLMFSVFFFNPNDLIAVLSLSTLALAYLFIWARGTLPRLRYDKLMHLAWKIFLPVAISYLLFTYSFSMSLLLSL